MDLLLVRHGEPAWVTQTGKPDMDPPLTDRGREQAHRVAERLAKDKRKPTEILVSPAVRAKQTAQPLAALTGLEPKVIDDLVEFKLPDWSHLSPIEVATNFRAMRERHPNAWWEGAPGGETFHAFERRIQTCLFDLLRSRGVEVETEGSRHVWKQKGDPGRIVIVAHGGTNSLVMSLLLGMETVPWIWERIGLHHASIIRIRTLAIGGSSIMSLRAQNDCEHLPHELRTR